MRTTILALVLAFVAGCAFFERPERQVVLPGPDGVLGTADDIVTTEKDDSDAEKSADVVKTILTLLGFGAAGAAVVTGTEVASNIATNRKKRQ